jgi:tRNA G18 (ribose-2'-O)-methylase SpoU
MQRIASIDDPRLAPYRHLKETNATRRDGLFICEGEKLARRLLDSHFDVASLLVGESLASEYSDVAPSIAVYVVPDDSIEGIVGFNFHRGVLACGKRRQPLSLDDLCSNLGEQATLAVCPDVQDPENLGTILRIASAFGVNGVLIGQKTADPWSRRVLRVSMGASLRLPIVASNDLARDLRLLNERWQIERWATVLDTDATPIRQATRPKRLALLFGSEGHGLDRDLIDVCDKRVTIPMAPGVDSLNVAVAAGIFFYEAMRS